MGCGASTPYKKFGFGGGYKEKEISEGVYELYYAGNGFSTLEEIRELWLLRAADTCEGSAYEYRITSGGKNSYDVYAGAAIPMTVKFPEVEGIVRCKAVEDS